LNTTSTLTSGSTGFCAASRRASMSPRHPNGSRSGSRLEYLGT
jgi:hypothetical protein